MVRFKSWFTAKNIAYLAVLLALVIVLQIWGGFIRIGATPLSFVLVPIVLGALLLGVAGGSVLGLAFGIVVLVQGILTDPFTQFLFSDSPVMTVIICLGKGFLAGFVPAIVYKFLRKKNELVAVFVASACAPLMNTGFFILGCLIINGTINGYIASVGLTGTNSIYFLFILCAGINFIIEFAINLICAPALHRVVKVVEKQVMHKSHTVPAKADAVETAAQQTSPETEKIS